MSISALIYYPLNMIDIYMYSVSVNSVNICLYYIRTPTRQRSGA